MFYNCERAEEAQIHGIENFVHGSSACIGVFCYEQKKRGSVQLAKSLF